MNWNNYFMNIAKTVSLKSKDPSTTVGAVIVGPDLEIRSTGFNGFPRGVKDNTQLYKDRYIRPKKYLFSAHAEENAIVQAARSGVSLLGCSIFIYSSTGIPPCAGCARMIIQSGINQVMFNFKEVPKRWKSSINAAKEMFRECDCQYYPIEIEGE